MPSALVQQRSAQRRAATGFLWAALAFGALSGADATAAEQRRNVGEPPAWTAFAPPDNPVREQFVLLPVSAARPPSANPAGSDAVTPTPAPKPENLANRPALAATPVAVARAAAARPDETVAIMAGGDRLAAMARPEIPAPPPAARRAPEAAFQHGASIGDGVPKTLGDLRAQLGNAFVYAQRSGFLAASDLPPAAFESLVDGILAYARQALVRDYFPAAAGADAPVTVYVFKDAASYEANLLRHFRMAPVSPYGHYAHRQRYLVVNGDTGPGTLVHEMTHALMAVDFPEAPIWLAEGLASLYEQCRVENGRLAGEANWRLPELRAALDQGRMPSLARLLALEPRAFRSGAESLNYAHARYFCLYLETRGHLRDVYRTVRDRHGEDAAGRRSVEAVTGQSLADLDRDFRRWLAGCRWDG